MAGSPFVALEAFDWSTPRLADACLSLELPVRPGPPGLVPLLPAVRVAAPVAPVVHAGDADVLLEAIAGATWGDVLVVDNNGRLDEACFGELLAAEAHASGLAGVVIDGAHRGSAAIRTVGLPLWSRGRCAFGPRELRRRHVTALEAATCGPTTVTREDAIFADEDGVVFIALAECARVFERARAMALHAEAQAARIESGQPLRDQLQLSAFIARRESDPDYTFRKHVQSLVKS
jgi:regulator of RNase E activity RraA